MLKFKTFAVLIFVISLPAYAQVIYTPLNSPVYNFLDRMGTEQFIKLTDEVKPYSRMKIAEYLKTIILNKEKLNDVEAAQLKWYAEEYAHELKSTDERNFLFKYSDSLFTFRVSPFAAYGISRTGSNYGHTRWWGINTYGSLSDWFGGAFSYKDIGQFGSNVDIKKNFTPERGYFINARPSGGIEFSDVKGAINVNWNWGTFSVIKDDIQWGHGKFGQLILSDKPESYPQIRFSIQPVKWLRFYYMYGWLNSLIIDSSATYYAHLESIKPVIHQQYVNKYVVANMLTITPVDGLDISIGNSDVYSGDIRPEFFIPFLYFKVMDHNTGLGSTGDSNGQIYFDVSSRNLLNYQFYATLFIDSGSIRNLLNLDFHQWWVGYTIGIKRVNIIPNLDITLEYTLISPWVYENKYEADTYKHMGFPLGDWLGQNADQLRLQTDYKFSQPLTLHLYFENIRKGGLGDIYIPYFTDITEPFLYGLVRKDFNIGLAAEYELYHDLFINAVVKHSIISDQDSTRTPDYLLGNKISLSLTVSYGL